MPTKACPTGCLLVASQCPDRETAWRDNLGHAQCSRGLVHTCANDKKDSTPNSCGWTIRGMLMFCTMAYTPMGMPAAPQMHLRARKPDKISIAGTFGLGRNIHQKLRKPFGRFLPVALPHLREGLPFHLDRMPATRSTRKGVSRLVRSGQV